MELNSWSWQEQATMGCAPAALVKSMEAMLGGFSVMLGIGTAPESSLVASMENRRFTSTFFL